MTRGKYAAKAANRLARLDNELLQEKVAEIADLNRRVDEHAATIQRERAERDACITHKANELSHQLIASARKDALDVQTQCASEKRALADWLIDYVLGLVEENPDIAVVPHDIEGILDTLVGPADVGEYLSRLLSGHGEGWGNRQHRRLSTGKVRTNRTDKTRPTWARGVGNVGYLELKS